MPNDYPYPTPFELLRYVLRSLDFKLPEKDKKRLDDMAGKRVYDPREFNTALEQYFSDISDKYIGRIAAEQLSKHITLFVHHYLDKVAGVYPADGLSRSFTLELMIKTSLKDQLVSFATILHDAIGGPQPSFWFASNTSSVSAIISWLTDNEKHWNLYLTSLNKERRDMIAAWINGEHLPSAQSIQLLSKPDTPSDQPINSINWDLIKPLLFVARSIDYIKKYELGQILIDEARLALWGAESKVNLSKAIRSKQAGILQSLGPAQNLIGKLKFDLRRTQKKSNPEEYRSIIIQVRDLIKTSEKLLNADYWIDWHDARWHVFSGDLKTANDLYKDAFVKAAFVAGVNQKYIAEEAIVVAACQPNPDKVFLKQLKWMQINFGYDIPSITGSAPSQKVPDTIEEWEIDLWRSSFDFVFLKAGLFPDIDYSTMKTTLGPLLFSDYSKIKPDYRSPNRTIKVGETWQRAMPQLVWFARVEDIEVCKKLIELGANVNVQSEVGDTPIIMALEALNVTEVPWRSLNDELFELISKEKHTKETINTRTQKRRLLPIISAVETGQPNIVEKILGMGADPDGRGLSDEQTALNLCLKHIGKIKDPDKSWKHQDAMPETPEVLDSLRRHSSGLSGFTLEHQMKYLKSLKDDLVFNECKNIVKKLMTERMLEKMSIDSMRNIARQLITSGADVNAEHASPLKGYTPLMLAVELDERSIFETMLIHGANIKQTYKDPRNGKDVSITDIANYFCSKGILQVLKDISPYATVHE
jgi:hypothetical protein